MNSVRKFLNPKIYHKVFQKCMSSDLYEPPYLADMIPKVPIYEELNIFFRGYDYPVLENCQKFVHKLLKNMEIEVEDCWAMPPKHLQVTVLKPKSELLEFQYDLKLYERVIQVVDVKSTELPLIIRAIEACLPAGVKVQIRQHKESDEESRYVPDIELNTLKGELESMGGPSKKK